VLYEGQTGQFIRRKGVRDMILVTGATGFLGSRLCEKLDERNMPYIKTSLSMGLDLRDEKSTVDYFCTEKPDYVCNCAAFLGGVQFGYEHAAEMFRNNMLMQQSLLEACRRAGVKRLVNPIGNCSYPGGVNLYTESGFWDGPLHESVKAYGLARKSFCVGAWAYNKQYGLDTINLVFSNMYGPNDHFDEVRSHAVGALIMKFVKAAEEGLDKVVVWGTGTPIREWLHVDDGCEAMIRALDIEPYNDIINVGVARGYSIKETAEMIGRMIGYEGNIVYDTSKLDGAPCKRVDGTLCRKLLHWSPEIPFETGLEETVRWYLAHRKG